MSRAPYTLGLRGGQIASYFAAVSSSTTDAGEHEQDARRLNSTPSKRSGRAARNRTARHERADVGSQVIDRVDADHGATVPCSRTPRRTERPSRAAGRRAGALQIREGQLLAAQRDARPGRHTREHAHDAAGPQASRKRPTLSSRKVVATSDMEHLEAPRTIGHRLPPCRRFKLNSEAMRVQAIAWMVPFLACAGISCQDYPFELRPRQRDDARKITEVDRDGSAGRHPVRGRQLRRSMSDEIAALKGNMAAFVEALSQEENEFQIGVITPDVECNVPERDCSSSSGRPLPPAAPELPAAGRCASTPTPIPMTAWTESTARTVTADGCVPRSPAAASSSAPRKTSATPGSRSSARCSTASAPTAPPSRRRSRRRCAPSRCATGNGCTLPRDQPVADLNAGFIRESADLVIIFVTDEDDCSFIAADDPDGHRLRPGERGGSRAAPIPRTPTSAPRPSATRYYDTMGALTTQFSCGPLGQAQSASCRRRCRAASRATSTRSSRPRAGT